MKPYTVIDTIKQVNYEVYSKVVVFFASNSEEFTAFSTSVSSNPYEALLSIAHIDKYMSPVELKLLQDKLC